MAEVVSLRNKLNKKLKLGVGTARTFKRRGEEIKYKRDSVDSERGTSKRNSRLGSRDGVEKNREFGVENSDLKRKRVYADSGVNKEGREFNGGVPNRHSRGVNKEGRGFNGGEPNGKSRGFNKEGREFNGGVVNRKSRGFNKEGREFNGGEPNGKSRGFNKEGRGFNGGEPNGKSHGFNKEGREFNGGVSNRNSLSRMGRIDKDDSFKGKNSGQYKSRDVEQLNREELSSSRGRNNRKDEINEEKSREKENESLRGGYKGRADHSVDVKRFSSRMKERLGSEEVSDSILKSKTKQRDRWVSDKHDEISDGNSKSKAKNKDGWTSTKQVHVEDGVKKLHSRNKTDSNKLTDQRPSNRGQVGSLENSTKKMLRSKKVLEENSDADGPPKKIKKAMRIDPHDISNKRLDDGISIDGKTVDKKADPDKIMEVSKNAQFRAIQPNPSILAFVEDNLLGRRRTIDLRRAGYNIDLSAPLDNIPLSTNPERERIEEAVFRNKLDFFAAAKVSSSFPPADLPEIAFAGRSNVGKSSLLNALTRQWGVVRTSDKPGLTQTINFFKLGSKLCMVDLPGYGFAYAKEEVKDAWEELVKEYVSTRVGLQRVCLLIDTKWGMKPRDHELINLMERSQTKYQIVLTKSDTVFPMDVARRAMQIEDTLKANKSVVQPLMMVSSKSGGGIRSLRTVLAKIARFTK